MHRLKRNPQQKLGLVLVTVQEAVGIEKMFRTPARVADFGGRSDRPDSAKDDPNPQAVLVTVLFPLVSIPADPG